MEVALQENTGVIKVRVGEGAEIYSQTSYRSLRTENGFNTNPTATWVVAPSRRSLNRSAQGERRRTAFLDRVFGLLRRGERWP